MLIDTHAHLDSREFEGQIEDVLERAKRAEVFKVVTIGASVNESKKALEVAKIYDEVWSAAGIHPEWSAQIRKEKKDVEELVWENIFKIAQEKEVVAIGEIGLDYHYKEIDKEVQKKLFSEQIKLSKKLEKPVVVHLRDCGEDADDILKDLGGNFVLHSFTGNWKRAERVLDWGGILGFGGIVTYGDKKLEEAVCRVDSSKYILETDCPFLAPVPLRGKINEPKNIYYIAEFISELRGESLDKVSRDSTNTAQHFFGI